MNFPIFLLAFFLFPARAALPPPPDPRISVEARAFKPGEIILVNVEGHDPKRAPEAVLNGQALQFFPAASSGTWLAFAGLDLESSTGPAVLSAVLRAPGSPPVKKSEILSIAAADFPVVRLHVDQKFVTPDKNDAERAEGEAARLHRLFAHGEEKRLFEGRFDPPIPGALTGHFGERRIFNESPRAPHSGMDLKASHGKPVRAPASGRVVLADPLFYSGNTLVIDHGLGLTTLYAHLSGMAVKAGDMVKKGQLIGKVGASGRVTGPHLHWALKFHSARIDPYSLTYLDLDAKLRPRAADPLRRSSFCASADLPPEPKWGKDSAGLRARARALKPAYAPGEAISLLVEIKNFGKKNVYLDFVRDPALRPWVLGIGQPPQRYDALASSQVVSGSPTEQVKISPRSTLCFEQDRAAWGPLLVGQTTSWSLVYGTEHLYASTSTARAGVWNGRLLFNPVRINVSTTD
ncbi:MAG: M23 family metallopeptidase [Elusimicrobiota bacterium]